MSRSHAPDPTAGASSEGHEERSHHGSSATRGGSGLYLYGVTRSRGWRGGAQHGGEDLDAVRYRDLEALVRPARFEAPPLDDERLRSHQRAVEAAMRKETILPAPFGVVFRNRRLVIRFLEDQYIVLDEALALLEGHWELRLHILPGGGGAPDLDELALHLFSELRRFARAAVQLEASGPRLLSAAFLVQRTAWIEFVERADDLGSTQSDIAFDITGPWPPYDFVKMTV